VVAVLSWDGWVSKKLPRISVRVMESISRVARGIASEIFSQVIRVFMDMSA
jgi:hypothetical protein